MNGRRGFSLIEVLIGVAIIAGMSLLIQGTVGRVLTAKEKVERRDGAIGGAQIALSKMADDLAMSFLAGTTLKGTNAGYETGMKGGADEINFTSLAHYHYQTDAKDTDQVSIGYALKKGADGEALYRRESQRLSDKIDEGGKSYLLLGGVKEFKLEYYDMGKEEWVAEWDTSQVSALGKLPAAVKISLTVVETEEGEEVATHPFVTVVTLPLYKNEINF
ncbi:MAG: type II secretion system protein GspJ [Deltaproteobacteria bacterium]|nr:type II secretion system protein GspJ [Deltaproteobacteria bacterium]